MLSLNLPWKLSSLPCKSPVLGSPGTSALGKPQRPFPLATGSCRERAFGLSLRASPATRWCKRLPSVRRALLHVLLPWIPSGAPVRFTLCFLSYPLPLFREVKYKQLLVEGPPCFPAFPGFS